MVVVPEGKHMEPLKLLWNVVDTMDIIDMAIDMTGNYRRVYHVVNGNKGTLTYDNNGNLLYDGTQAYTYDAWNRLMTVAHAYRDSNGMYAGTWSLCREAGGFGIPW